MRLASLLIAFLLPLMAWLVVFNYTPEVTKRTLSQGEQKIATLTNFRGHDVTLKGEEFYLEGKTLEHFEGHDRFSGTTLDRKSPTLTEGLSSAKGIYQGGVYTLTGDVVYKRSDGVVLKSEKILIDKQSGRVVGPTAFVVVKNDTIRVEGSKFTVFEKTKKLECDTIKADILVEVKG